MLGQGWTIIYRIESNGRPIHALRIEEATNGLVWNQMPNFLEFAIDSIEQMTKHVPHYGLTRSMQRHMSMQHPDRAYSSSITISGPCFALRTPLWQFGAAEPGPAVLVEPVTLPANLRSM
jgi:hypothetical protein